MDYGWLCLSGDVCVTVLYLICFWYARCDAPFHAAWRGTRFEHKEQAEAELSGSEHSMHPGCGVTPTS